MSPAVWAPLAVVAAAVTSGVAAWLVARRTTSGRIDTSEAATLWAEAQKLRDEYRTDREAYRVEVAALRKRVADLEGRLADTQGKLGEAQYTASLLRAEVRELRALCGETGADVEQVKREMATARSLSAFLTDRRRRAEGAAPPGEETG